jgi:hypothetical protein
MAALSCSPSTWEAKIGSGVPGQPELCNNTLSWLKGSNYCKKIKKTLKI